MDANKEILNRIAEALERISPNIEKKIDLSKSNGFVYDDSTKNLKTVKKISRIPIQLLKGLENQKDILLKNTQNFSNNLPANNALLWGAKGTGKSSLVKSVHAEINKQSNKKVKPISVKVSPNFPINSCVNILKLKKILNKKNSIYKELNVSLKSKVSKTSKIIKAAGPSISNLEIEIVNDMMRNGWENYSYVEKFEKEFARFHNRKLGTN